MNAPAPSHRPDRVADALVLVFTAGVSLREWERTGMLEREWALYRRLAPSYGRLVLVTYGVDDGPVAAGLGPGVTLVCNSGGLEAVAYSASLAKRVGDATEGAGSVLVKTNQMEGGDAAVRIARHLRATGQRVGLVARGGYPWSRFVAWEQGPDSSAALEAGAREGELCRAAGVVVGTTETMVSDLAWRHGLAMGRMRVVPNYVLTPACDESAREQDRAGLSGKDGQTVLFAGRLTAQKRVGLLIEAMARLPEDLRAGTTLGIIGEGPQEAELRELARTLGVRAKFEGRIPHAALLERLGRCTVYAQVSSHEGHPKTVLEAMSAGAAVLVSDGPGLGEVVEPGQTGVRVAGHADVIAAELAVLLRDPGLRGRLGRVARREVRKRLSLDRVIDLELGAHAAALERAGEAARPTPAPVRWEPDLLATDTEGATAAWEASLRGFSRRLAPKERSRFLLALDAPLYSLQGQAAVETEGGLHPKHRLMRYHDFFVERLERGARVIDLGSGVGALACSMARRARVHVTGMDWDESNLARSRQAATVLDEGEDAGPGGSLQWVLGDITTHRAEGEFQVVVLSNVLEHLRDRAALLRKWREWYRATTFLIRVPAFDREWRAPWKKELGVEWRLDPTHETEYTQAQLERELGHAGLTITECVARWGEYWVSATPG